MQKLGCIPKLIQIHAQLIQPYLNNDLIKDQVKDGMEMKTIRLEMRYDKKNKLWYGRQRMP